MELLELKVELPMVLEIDYKGGKDYIDKWGVGGRMRHVQTRFHFLRELKEKEIIKIKWISTDENTADIFMKNLSGPMFEKHARTVIGDDEYFGGSNIESTLTRDSQGESVRVGKLTNKNKGKIGHPTEVADSEATYKREHVGRTNHEETTQDTETGATQGKWVREKDSGFVERLWDQEKDGEIRITWTKINGDKSRLNSCGTVAMGLSWLMNRNSKKESDN